jgi:CheY-like chemotaxis protein
LTGGVAHDFNNLLMPIIASLDMLQRRKLGGEREQRMIAGGLQSADRAKTLVQRLLAFARRQPLQPVAVDVSAVVGGMVGLIASVSGPQISVAVDLADDLPAAHADANQLEMAILNLSVNARDAMPEGGTLRVSARREWVGGPVAGGHPAPPQHAPNQPRGLKPGCYVRLSIADTGAGMDEATLARAVEPFFSTKGVGKGTGLGLSMAHGLASQLGGALAISSKRGLGTNVELWLPASADPVAAASTAPQEEAAPSSAGTVLLVDDEELVRMSTAEMLTDLGYAVKEAGSADEALKAIDSGMPIDLLITDHLMPGMSGVELAHAARALRPNLPVLIVSGFAEADTIAADLPRLTKPFRSADLQASLAGVLPVGKAEAMPD